MSRSSRHKEKHGKSSEISTDYYNDGTAARTRPLSFDEIMLKRKDKKKLFDSENKGFAEGMSEDGTTEKVSERGNGRSKDEHMKIISERSNRRSKDENTEGVSERGDRRSKDESTEKVSEMGDRRSKDESTEKVSEMGDRRSKDESTKKVSERGDRRSKDEHLEIVSERGSRRTKDEKAEKVSERIDRRSKGENTEKVSERGNRRSKDENTEKMSERGNRRSKDENTEKVSERGNRRNRNGNTENASERGNKRSKDENTEKVPERGNARSKYSSYVVREHLLERDAKAISKEKEEKTSMKDEYITKSKDREIQDSEVKLKSEVHRDLKPKGRAGEEIYDRRKSDEQRSNNVKNEDLKKHPRHLTERVRHEDGSRGVSEREDKSKYRKGVDEKNKDRLPTRKHDLGKGHDSENLDKKEKDELSKSHYEEIKLKSRRSRSREREDRKRRSISPLPRSRKHASYHDREHGEPSLHFLKGKSGQQHSDIDRNKITNNGSTGHYKRHGGSASRLGGYSPRKRRSEAAARTPSPTKHSPEKKKAKWDLAPEGADSTFSVSVPPIFKLSNQIASLNARATVSAVPVASIPVKPLSGVSSNILLTNKNDTIDSVQLTQATRPMRRLYVENIPAEASEKAVLERLNNLLISSGVNHIQGTQPCISCIIHKEKGQALVEFLTPEDASAALSFDGSYFSGSTIKIRRPKDFVEMAGVYIGCVIFHILDGDEAVA